MFSLCMFSHPVVATIIMKHLGAWHPQPPRVLRTAAYTLTLAIRYRLDLLLAITQILKSHNLPRFLLCLEINS
jgi:hypothetical protein